MKSVKRWNLDKLKDNNDAKLFYTLIRFLLSGIKVTIFL